jgi:hypothetical protein
MDLANKIVNAVQIMSIVAGVVISISSFNETRRKDAEEHMRDQDARIAEATKPFYELRQKLYVDAARQAGILANPGDHKPDELKTARQRFRDLYLIELCMVESPGVEAAMMAFANKVDPTILNLNDTQRAAFELAHALGESYAGPFGSTGATEGKMRAVGLSANVSPLPAPPPTAVSSPR